MNGQGPSPQQVPGVAPDELAAIQSDFLSGWQALVDQARRGSLSVPADRRFSSPAWLTHPQALFAAHAYLLTAEQRNLLALFG